MALFEEHIGKVHIHVECSDDFSRDFETLKELIAYRNPKSKDIQHIYLTAYSDDYSKSKSAAIVFVGSSWPGILIRFKGPENTVSRLKEETLVLLQEYAHGIILCIIPKLAQQSLLSLA